MEIKKLLSTLLETGKLRLCSPKILGICVGVWVLFQIVFVSVYRYSGFGINDPGTYLYNALECVKHGTMYPDYANFHDEFIQNPGWVNFIILWIKLFGSACLIPYFCILLNVLILYLLYKTTCKVTESKGIIYLVLYFFMLLPGNSTIILHLLTEIPFEALSLLSFYLVFSKKSWLVLLAGISIALAQWIRPLGVAWMLAALFFMLYKDRRIKHAIIYVAGVVFTCGSIGIATHRNFPTYVFQASTGGINLLFGANDLAMSRSNAACSSPEGLGYLPGLFSENEYTPVRYDRGGGFLHKYSGRYTYLECDSIRTARAIGWIKENPGRWCLLFPGKIFWTFAAVVPYAHVTDPVLNESPDLKIIRVICKIAGCSFAIMVLMAFAGLFTPFWKDKKLIYVVIPIVVCTAMMVVTIGGMRFNFIIIPFILIFCCYSLKYYKNKYID